MKFPNQAKLFKKVRRHHKLTQKELADILDVHCQFVSNVERGISTFPFDRFRLMSHLVTKKMIKDACMKDYELIFEKEWKR